MSIKFNGIDIENVVFNGVALDVVICNDVVVFEKTPYLNFTGLDANGNLYGTTSFTEPIVAYAVGKPTITITTNEDGSQSERIVYEYDNGFNSEYFGGYDFTTNLGDNVNPIQNPESFIVPETLNIPEEYLKLPIKKILPNAFAGGIPSTAGSTEATYQAKGIREIILPNGLEEIGSGAFSFIRYLDQTKYNKDFLPNTLKVIGDDALRSVRCAYLSGTVVLGSAIEIDLPQNVESVGRAFFEGAIGNNIINDYAVSITPTSSNGVFDSINTVRFKNTVEELSGLLFYQYPPSTLVFEHSANAQIIIDISALKSATEMTIYSDNTIVNNYDWASKNITATILPLSDYQG